MKRIGLIAGLLLILSVAGLVLYEAWPKYGICLQSSRYDEIACVARRNLHFSAHLSWSYNRSTVEAVMAEASPEDIPVLADMLGDGSGLLRSLAGSILTEMGDAGLDALKQAAESPDPVVARTARSALMDYEITRESPPPQD